jgi:hypothetical protein
MQLTAFGTRNLLSSEFENIDARCSLLPGQPTLRKLLLGMQTRQSDGTPPTRPQGPIFLSVDAAVRHTDRGSFVVTYTVDNAVEAEEKLKNLLSYLAHEHGDSATYWFSSAAIDRADHMQWDDKNDRPITIEELDLDDLLQDELDWVANMNAVDISFTPASVEIMLARPSLLHKVSNNPLLGEADSVQTFHHGVTSLPTHGDGDNSANRAAATGDNPDAGDLQGSLAGAV